MASFSVCVMARERPGVILKLMRHYRKLRSERVRIVFDGEADEVDLAETEGLDLVVCDRAFWMRHLRG